MKKKSDLKKEIKALKDELEMLTDDYEHIFSLYLAAEKDNIIHVDKMTAMLSDIARLEDDANFWHDAHANLVQNVHGVVDLLHERIIMENDQFHGENHMEEEDIYG